MHSLKTYFTLLLLTLLCAAMPAHASEPFLQVEMNKGQMVRLDKPAATVIVADPAIADIQIISPRAVFVHGKQIGETTVHAIDDRDQPIMNMTVEVTHNISKLSRMMKSAVPDSDINFRSVNNGIVMEGYVDTPSEAKSAADLATGFLGANQALVNLVNTAGSDQVTLQVKIAEVSRSELKRFGINLLATLNSADFAFSLVQGRDIYNLDTGNLLRNGSDTSIFGGYNGSKLDVSSIIDALEDNDLVSILAEPSLTTSSGKTANFLAGGEFPIPMVDNDGNVSVMYKPFGISLNFTPTVMSRDKISLNVTPEVSTISSLDALTVGTASTFAIPSIQTRRARTTVELGSGQTFAIAGLFKNDRSNNINRFPGLGELPVLGALFRSHEFQNDQSELVILVTPYIVRPVSEHKMATPLDGFTPPSDTERLLMGKFYQEQPEADAPEGTPQARLNGKSGFILE